MDLSFARFDALARRQEVLLDYPSLLVSLAALQAATATAIAEARFSDSPPPSSGQLPALVTLLGARAGWTAAVATLGGSFHPGLAMRLATRGTKGS